MDARVVRICIAPVKALHVFERDEVELTRAGVVGDRRFWLVDRDRRLVNGKAHPKLMRVRPEWDEASRRLALSFPDGSVVEGEVQPGELFEAELYGTPHPSRLVPGPWQEALSEFVGEPVTTLVPLVVVVVGVIVFAAILGSLTGRAAGKTRPALVFRSE